MSAATPASLTNQKLDSARRFLRQSQDGNESWLSVGLESAAIFHLRSALNGLLQEVSLAYQLASGLQLESLLREAQANGVVVPVLAELQDLSSQPNSWLNQLEQAYLVQFECRSSMFAKTSEANLIGRGGDDGASINLFLSKLTELVLRFREESSEY
ncbi:hypothetical protein GCM10009112_26050 [Marinomonas arenicola]|uniref:DUF6586 family protein n=1 Tax=Marinomonas TaxID=28253 RepID=UPI00105504D9|nr:DUF6586 family protein [Marinomonas sp. KMM3893]